MEVRHDEQPEVLHEKVRVENAKEIRGGDELRNINSYEYLLRIFQALENVVRDTLHQDPRSVSLPKGFFPLDQIYELFKEYSDYNPGYAYGDLYTRFILDLEDNLEKIKEYVTNERLNLEQDNELQRARVINYTSNIAQSEGTVKK